MNRQRLIALFVLFITAAIFLMILITVPYVFFLILKLFFETLKFTLIFIVIFWLIFIIFSWIYKFGRIR
jgi:hypothetical protein